MKKLLLTLAAGVLILALPVIASAQVTFTEYSGHAAKIGLTGFARYSSATGVTYGHVGSGWAQTAKTTTAKNTIGRFDWNSDGYFEIEMQLNDNTWMEIEGQNPVKISKNSNTTISNVEFEIWETTGATITSPDGWTFNYSDTGSVLELEGAAVAYIVKDPRKGTLVISLKKPTVSWTPVTLITDGVPDSTTNWNPGLAFTGIIIPPFKLIPTGNTGTW